jgi:hypothetical protein
MGVTNLKMCGVAESMLLYVEGKEAQMKDLEMLHGGKNIMAVSFESCNLETYCETRRRIRYFENRMVCQWKSASSMELDI